MKTPQVPAMLGMSPLGLKPKANPAMDAAFASMLNRKSQDQKVWSERQWQGRKLAPAPQKPCDHGLFSDEANQLDLVEMLQDPTNGE